MSKPALKTVTPKPQTITEQIADLNTRKGGLQAGIGKIHDSNQTFQKRLDDAEAKLVDCITDQMADDTPKTREAVSDARVAKGVLTNQFEHHRNDLKLIPKAIDKLNAQIQVLTAQKSALEREVIADKLTNMDELKANAREAISELAAAWCIETTRNPNFTDVKLVVAKLDKDRSVSADFHHKYNELEASMGFDSL